MNFSRSKQQICRLEEQLSNDIILNQQKWKTKELNEQIDQSEPEGKGKVLFTSFQEKPFNLSTSRFCLNELSQKLINHTSIHTKNSSTTNDKFSKQV